MVIAIRKDLAMSPGKLVAQGAHAAVGAFMAAQLMIPAPGESRWASEWTDEHAQKKVVVAVDSEDVLEELADAAIQFGLPWYVVQDHGRTEVEAGTRTAIALGPAPSSLLDPITGSLPLL